MTSPWSPPAARPVSPGSKLSEPAAQTQRAAGAEPKLEPLIWCVLAAAARIVVAAEVAADRPADHMSDQRTGDYVRQPVVVAVDHRDADHQREWVPDRGQPNL